MGIPLFVSERSGPQATTRPLSVGCLIFSQRIRSTSRDHFEADRYCRLKRRYRVNASLETTWTKMKDQGQVVYVFRTESSKELPPKPRRDSVSFEC